MEQEASESDFDIEIEYDCSSLTLEQSVKQVFNIMNTIKMPSIEKQQLSALQSHVFKMMLEQSEVQGRRSIKQQRKSLMQMRGAFSTAQKALPQELLVEEEEDCEVSAFDLKTPGKGAVSKEINKIMTRS